MKSLLQGEEATPMAAHPDMEVVEVVAAIAATMVAVVVVAAAAAMEEDQVLVGQEVEGGCATWGK
jgi:hypothetical protein